jgi:hypothetical protein
MKNMESHDLKETREVARRQDSYAKAMRRSFRRKPFLTSDGRYPLRAEVHERANLRSREEARK